MRNSESGRKGWLLTLSSCAVGLALLFLVHLWLAGGSLGGGSQVVTGGGSLNPNFVAQGNQNLPLYNGRVPSLSWIVGRDCLNGVKAYLQHATTNPDAALVGPGWLDPTTGKLINGESNNCVPGSLSMDSVIQLVHQHGGKVYLTIAVETDGTSSSWTTAQETAYVVKASQTPGYIDPILQEVQRADYDGLIMDLEGTDNFYPNIQQIFATYNQQIWQEMQGLHKPYGIALLHKTSDHDEYYGINGFENWHLLSKSADFIVVMAVDQSYFTPGPCVSVPWLQQLLNYTLRTMPQMLPYIIWELPLYGDFWHQVGGRWVFDNTIDYQSAQQIVQRVSQSQIDQANTNLQDPYQPHLVYTDASGVKQSLWFMDSRSLYNVMHDFQNILRKQPHFAQGRLQFAIWWSTTAEPVGFWEQVNKLY